MAAPHDLPLPGPTAPKKTVKPTTDKPVTKKPASLTAQANAIVNSELNPSLAQTRLQGAQQNTAIANFTKMLLQAVSGIPGGIGAGYDQAINRQTSIANAAADALRNANPNQQDQHILDAVGAPDSQHQQIASPRAGRRRAQVREEGQGHARHGDQHADRLAAGERFDAQDTGHGHGGHASAGLAPFAKQPKPRHARTQRLTLD